MPGIKDQRSDLFDLVENVHSDNHTQDMVCDRPFWQCWESRVLFLLALLGGWLNLELIFDMGVDFSISDAIRDQFTEWCGTKRCEHLQSTKCNINCLQQT